MLARRPRLTQVSPAAKRAATIVLVCAAVMVVLVLVALTIAPGLYRQ